MGIKARDLRSVSNDELYMYIVELKLQHDKTVALTHDLGIKACAPQIREIEEELCWAEHEAEVRIDRRTQQHSN